MAIDAKLRKELATHVKLGETVEYFSRNNEADKSTMTDPHNLFEDAIKKGQDLEILQAIYDVSADNKFNGAPYVVSKSGSKFIVTDIKTAESDEIKIVKKPTVYIVSDKITKKTTTIELNKVIEKEKAETVPFRTQIENALKTAKNDNQSIKLITAALNT